MPVLLIKMKDNAGCVLTAAELCAMSEMLSTVVAVEEFASVHRIGYHAYDLC